MRGITVDQLENARQMLKEMAENKKDARISKADAIAELMKHIKAVRTSGYTLEEIAEALTEKDIAISSGTLKSYLARGQKSKGQKKKGGIRKASENGPERTESGKSKGSSAAERTAKLDAAPKGGSGSDGTFNPQPDSDEL